MKGRFANVRTLKQVDFIKRKYKEAYQTVFGAMDELKVGDKVVMHTCLEAKRYEEKFGLVEQSNLKQVVVHKWCVLEGFSGYFSVKYLQRISLLEN